MELASKIARRILRYRSEWSLYKTVRKGKRMSQPLVHGGTKFRVAVMGAGRMGRDQCLGLQALPQVEIAAVVDRDPEALARLRQQVNLDGARFYEDAEALLRAETVDLACIATNTVSHVEMAEMAVAAGVRRLIIEKPIGNQVERARWFAQMCAVHGVKLAVNHSRRWSSDYSAIRRCIEHGLIGTLRQIYAVPGPGGLGMTGVHYFDLMSYFSGSPIVWVQGYLEEPKKPNKRGTQFVAPGGYCLLGFENAMRGYLDVSDDLERMDSYMVLRGDGGRIEIDERRKEWHLINGIVGRRAFSFLDTTTIPGYFTKVAAQTLSEQPVSCGAAEGIAALEAVIGVHLSSTRDHSRVSVPLSEDDARLTLPLP